MQLIVCSIISGVKSNIKKLYRKEGHSATKGKTALFLSLARGMPTTSDTNKAKGKSSIFSSEIMLKYDLIMTFKLMTQFKS